MTAVQNEDGELRGLWAKVATLEQLLEVYERSVIEQAERIYAEQQKIRLQKTLLECQGQASLEGIVSVSTAGEVLSANRRLAVMWRLPQPVVPGDAWSSVLRCIAAQVARPDTFLARCGELADAPASRAEVALTDGRTIERYSAPIRGEDGEGLGRVWYFRDISESKRIERLKDEFISTVSHELRTPLTAIRGSLELLGANPSGPLPADAAKLISIARRSSERLSRLVDDILDLEKIGAGRLDFLTLPLELEPILAQAIESMRPYGERFTVSFRLDVRAPSARAVVDPDRVGQVLENLLSNAAKFSPRGGTVDVRLLRSGSRIQIEVEDRGPGIPPEFQPRVFERFAQADASSTRRKGGTGLGLSIARAIVERLGGSIGFDSRPGVGTLFRVELPEWIPPSTLGRDDDAAPGSGEPETCA